MSSAPSVAARFLRGTYCLPRATFVACLIAALAGAVAGFQLFGTGRDTGQYWAYFDAIRTGAFGVIAEYRFEAGFAFVAATLIALGLPNPMLVAVFTFVSVAAKTRLFWSRLNTINAIVLSVYFVRFYPLHELTQIRAALAIAIGLWAVDNALRGHRRRSMLLLATAATFHYSIVILAPFILAVRLLANRYTGLLLACAYGVVAFFAVRSFGDALPAVMPDSLRFYVETPEPDFALNALSIPRIIDLMALGWLLTRFGKIGTSAQVHTIIFAAGQILFLATASVPVIALRLSELLSVSWCLALKGAMEHVRSTPYRLFGAALATANVLGYAYLLFWKYALFA